MIEIFEQIVIKQLFEMIIEQILKQIIIEQLFEPIIIEQLFEQIIIEQLFEQIIIEQLIEIIIYQIFGPVKMIITISAGDHHNNLSGARRANFGQVLVIYWSLLQYNYVALRSIL